MKIAVYPGTFDPITYGHIDVIKKSLNIFDKLIVATSENNDKDYYFSVDQRIDIINNSLFRDLKFSKKNINLRFKNIMMSIHISLNLQMLLKFFTYLEIL